MTRSSSLTPVGSGRAPSVETSASAHRREPRPPPSRRPGRGDRRPERVPRPAARAAAHPAQRGRVAGGAEVAHVGAGARAWCRDHGGTLGTGCHIAACRSLTATPDPVRSSGHGGAGTFGAGSLGGAARRPGPPRPPAGRACPASTRSTGAARGAGGAHGLGARGGLERPAWPASHRVGVASGGVRCRRLPALGARLGHGPHAERGRHGRHRGGPRCRLRVRRGVRRARPGRPVGTAGGG